ncbi:MAG: protease inhibitor I42 family protein [Treponema sp.]|nr:protease inhibitor I42 family protein [Treponema sp.]
MKKAAVGTASLIMALLIASCASSKAANVSGKKVTIPASLEETGMEAVENGTTAGISFDANATTGYAWDYAFDEEGIIEEKASSYDTDAHSEGIVGYGGRQRYSFKAVRAGSTTARFSYRRPWDPGSEVYQVSVDFTVDAAGTIHITAIY